jgi:hypothetical protein
MNRSAKRTRPRVVAVRDDDIGLCSYCREAKAEQAQAENPLFELCSHDFFTACFGEKRTMGGKSTPSVFLTKNSFVQLVGER